mgnify:CR=1 FL=1
MVENSPRSGRATATVTAPAVITEAAAIATPAFLFLFFIYYTHFSLAHNLSRMLRHSCCEVRVMQLHDILQLRTSVILPEAISDGGLAPTTDTSLFLTTYRTPLKKSLFCTKQHKIKYTCMFCTTIYCM